MTALDERVSGLVDFAHEPVLGTDESRLELWPGPGTFKPYRYVGGGPRRPRHGRVTILHVLQDRHPVRLDRHRVRDPISEPPSSGRLAARSIGAISKSATPPFAEMPIVVAPWAFSDRRLA